ncbi:unnamed protein product [Lymnaea stagnalis]|uniref:Uncharacterized protein n=1 Tax=Lymnaea stagnalis TaxID=6523 RepID=A0AAV2IJQ4_LYMST
MEASHLDSRISPLGINVEAIDMLYKYATECQANCECIRKQLVMEMEANQVLTGQVEALKAQLARAESLLAANNSGREGVAAPDVDLHTQWETNDALLNSSEMNNRTTQEEFQSIVEKLQEKLVEKTFKIIEANTKLAIIEQEKKMKKTKKRIIEQLKKKKESEKSNRTEVQNTINVADELIGGSRKLGRFEIKPMLPECTRCLETFSSKTERANSVCHYHSCKPVLLETNVGKMYYWRCCSHAQFNTKMTKLGCQHGNHKFPSAQV